MILRGRPVNLSWRPGGVDQPYRNGIWWLIPTDSAPDAGLTLPTLPAGWIYEGWVASSSEGPVSTGTFLSGTGADSDGAGPTGGGDRDAAPPFPGQDFVNPAVDLTDDVARFAVISIEPVPDNDVGPFSYKPLVKAIDRISAALQPAAPHWILLLPHLWLDLLLSWFVVSGLNLL
jgi:hypothetical protein